MSSQTPQLTFLCEIFQYKPGAKIKKSENTNRWKNTTVVKVDYSNILKPKWFKPCYLDNTFYMFVYYETAQSFLKQVAEIKSILQAFTYSYFGNEASTFMSICLLFLLFGLMCPSQIY